MEYTDESVAEIAQAYSTLTASIAALKEVRESRDRQVIFGYVAEKYHDAETASLFLNQCTPELRERLKLDGLALKLNEFSNHPVGLPFCKG